MSAFCELIIMIIMKCSAWRALRRGVSDRGGGSRFSRRGADEGSRVQRQASKPSGMISADKKDIGQDSFY
jgi:hypothetical protein